MLGIAQISNFIPKMKLSNYELKDKFNIDELFIKEKLGFEYLSRKQKQENTSDLCIKAYEKLKNIN